MGVLLAPDKFKGSLSAPEAARAMARGVSSAISTAGLEFELDLAPMADGGEGTVEALVTATGGVYRETSVNGPLPMGRPVVVRYGMLGDGRTAVLEMAAASGLVLVPPHQRDPWRSTTRGTGELVLSAIDAGAEALDRGNRRQCHQ